MEGFAAKPFPSTDAPSASSSARERRFRDFLSGAFALLAEELPAVYARMCRQLAPRTVRLQVDEEVVSVIFTGDAAQLVEGPCAVAVEIRTTRATILDVIDAESSLVEAVLHDRLVLFGRLDDLVAFHDALMTFVHGAVRAPSFPALLRAYRHCGSRKVERSNVYG